MNTKNRSSLVTLLAVATATAATTAALAATSVNLLTDNATVRAAGNYTYYARGNGVSSGSDPAPETVTPFTKKFYPGAPHGVNDTAAKDGFLSDGIDNGIYATNGASIPFASGDLTNNLTTTTDSVYGWWGVTEITKTSWTPEGSFDILFDLGAAYTVTGIEIIYTDSGSRRWSTTIDIQKAYYAETLAGSTPSEGDFTLFGAGATTSNASAGTLNITPATGASVIARYLDLRLTTQIANSNTGAYGGYLHEVRIYGYETATPSIPEPATWAILSGAASLLTGFLIRHRRSSRK
ncbi:MAG: hypothetical protein LBK99_13905 [Opitutaceae bacterium]|jgi:hypothetical protein|nr:hypothetical protein [Opitutaceae bacterium]